MKIKFYLLQIRQYFYFVVLLIGLLFFPPLFAQNYNAGTGSGGSGDQNVFVGPYAGPL